MGSSLRSWTNLFLKPGIRRNKRQSQRAVHYDRKLHVEQFEDRRMLAVFTVTKDYDAIVNTTASAGTLRQAIFDAEQDAVADTINFAPSLDGATITLGKDINGASLNFNSNQGELDITESLSIDASALSGGLTIDASGNDNNLNLNNGGGSRVFNIQLTPTAGETQAITFDSLTITGGVYALAA